MQLTRNIRKEDLYHTYYSVMNGLLKLTPVELNVLVEFCKLQPSEYTFNKDNRKIVSKNLGMSIFNLNNYIRILKDKSIFVTINNQLEINPRILIKDTDKLSYKIEININIIK